MVDSLCAVLKDVWVLLKRQDNGYLLPSGIVKSRKCPDPFNRARGSGWVDALGLTGFTLQPRGGFLRCQKTGADWVIPTEYVPSGLPPRTEHIVSLDPESIHVPLPSLQKPDPSPVRRVSPAHGIGVMWAGGLETGRLFNGGL